MPAKDLTRWTYNEETDEWTRITANGDEERTAINPHATQGALDAAAELGVNLASVTGTGKNGKITKADVEAFVSE